MLVKNYKSIFQEVLFSFYDEKEIESFFYIILEQFHNLKRIDLALNPEMEITKSDIIRWENVLTELKKQKPIQYILGETAFYGMRFTVNGDTLIPRPETEELVAWIIEEASKGKLHKKDKISILDIGTGTGCIPISLAKNLIKSSVSAIDISQKALLIAKKNALLNNTKIDFFEMDILNTESLPQKFDIIVSINSKNFFYNICFSLNIYPE